jgi:Putative neutral zinc metallopeptidase
MFEDPVFWVLVLPGLLLGLYAQSRIKLNVAKYSQVPTRDGVTGAQVARRLLDAKGLQDVTIESTPGILSDHYDPRAKTLRLSQQVYFTPSVAAAGIAAHEAGHALQDAEDYFPMENPNIPRADSANRRASRTVAVYLGIDPAVGYPDVDGRHPFRLVISYGLSHSSSGVQRQWTGERAIGEPGYRSRR